MNAVATAPAATIKDTSQMGILDFKGAVENGTMTESQVLAILDVRIAKRIDAKKSPVAAVITYRNELAEIVAKATGQSIKILPVPVYAVKSAAPTGALQPDTPTNMADSIYNSIGPAQAGELVMKLTARLAGQ
jgi:hypothetical protein